MAKVVQVEPLERSTDASEVVFLDPHIMSHESIAEDDVVEVRTREGRTAVSRVGSPLETDHDTGFIRIPRDMRSALKATIGETVEVAEADVQPLSSVTFSPLTDVSGQSAEELAGYLKESFVNRGKLVNRGVIEYLSLPGMSHASSFKVTKAEPASGIVEDDTEVEVEYLFDTWGTVDEDTFADIGGLDAELQSVRELVEYPIRFPDVYQNIGINPARGVILFGPPGTGKTLMTRAISNELDAYFHYINGPSIISTGYGETEQKLREIFEEAQQNLPSIVLIDELDAIAPKREETSALADLRVVTQLLELMDGLGSVQGVMVVATTNRLDSVEPALRRPGRFDREVYIGPPDEKAREEILRIHTRGMLIEGGLTDRLGELVRSMRGYTGADIRELVREAGVNALRRQFPDTWETISRKELSLKDITVNYGDFESALGVVQPSVLRGALSQSTTMRMDDIGGLHREKERLETLIKGPLRHSESFQEVDLKLPKGILLTGPPGTGKTSLAMAAGNEFGTAFLQLDSSDVYSEWVGRSEKSIKEVFRIARRAAPSILLIDNLESIAGQHDDANSSGSVSSRVKSQLLAEIDRIQNHSVWIIGTTNEIELLDETFLAPNRFGEVIELGAPDESARREIIEKRLRSVDTDLTEEGLEEIAQGTEGWSGAQLDTLCQWAKLIALQENDYNVPVVVADSDIAAALDDVAA